ncbi:MAG: hypothetical protein ACTHJN_09465 [Ginsengibacter sp.]
MDTTKEEVEAFLKDFKEKMAIFEIVFYRSRGKNLMTFLELELSEISARKHLEELTHEDFYKGPSKDKDDGPELWEFGKIIKGREVYIKITRGYLNKPVIFISFHFAERIITYPFK